MIDPSRCRGLYAIADTTYLDDTRLLDAVTHAVNGGAQLIQYRDKSADAERRYRQAHALASLCRERDIVFIVNDDVNLAKAVQADGVHVGRDDAGLAAARAALGDRAIVGVSCYNERERAERAVAGGASYVALGSFFPSTTKPTAVRADLQLLRAIRARVSVPIVAIGGITPENGGALIDAGADALAVISGVFDQPDITAAARRYTDLFDIR
jgi:thiamine-phosphate pyrophosphorylase